MADERARITCVPRFSAQRHFPGGQRTNSANPRLDDNDTNGHKMRHPKPGVSDPGPVEKPSENYDEQTRNDKAHKQHMQQQNRISRERQ